LQSGINEAVVQKEMETIDAAKIKGKLKALRNRIFNGILFQISNISGNACKLVPAQRKWRLERLG